MKLTKIVKPILRLRNDGGIVLSISAGPIALIRTQWLFFKYKTVFVLKQHTPVDLISVADPNPNPDPNPRGSELF